MRKRFVFFFIVLFALMLPIQAWAVEFTITDVKIDAYLQQSGEVKVREIHTYSFDDKFRGITREIIPKKGAEITGFKAKEGEKTLKVKKEKHLYKVYRSGNHEDITVELQYVIQNSLSKHPDMTEFYWPFFDERNESDYGRMTITVHPPSETNDVISLGYDEAFGKETVENNGAVTFYLNGVDAGTNGDIRVAYDSELFPGLAQTSGQNIRQSLLDEKQSMMDKAKQFAENREKASVWGKWLLFVCAAVLTGLLTSEAAGKKQKKRAAREEVYKRKKMIPQHKMNMPAVLYFLNHDHTPDLLAAALMDLVRKGNVRQISEEKFILLHQDTDENHERILLELLFNRVGKDGSFSLEDLEQYVQREVNRATYQEEMANWLRAVKEEINRFNLYEAKPAFRWTLGIAGLSVLASSIFFIIYGLYGLMSAAIAAGLASLCLAVFYRPLSYEGLLLKEGWSRLEKGFGKMSTSEWDRISDDDKWRSLIYGVGAKKSRLADHFSQALQDAGQKPANDAMAYFLIATSFGKTEEYIHQSTASDSSAAGSFSGGGAGGGGGGSGAF